MKVTPESERIHWVNGRKEVLPSEAEIAEECRKIREDNLAAKRREPETETQEFDWEDDDEQDRD